MPSQTTYKSTKIINMSIWRKNLKCKAEEYKTLETTYGGAHLQTSCTSNVKYISRHIKDQEKLFKIFGSIYEKFFLFCKTIKPEVLQNESRCRKSINAVLIHHLLLFLDRRQRGPIRSVLLVIICWLVGWLVTQFSQKRL